MGGGPAVRDSAEMHMTTRNAFLAALAGAGGRAERRAMLRTPRNRGQSRLANIHPAPPFQSPTRMRRMPAGRLSRRAI